ncbi:ATP-binding protein [Chitinimonas koreensis]|uniref:ATP-binding protein n=1 Tax=Chitinimonas koreensis TaxID=356302 RepID=UPI0003FF49A2|nr:ATP-binding protein [Chitinimonas koreensis]QNM96603.1 response regulator [Chitinimonas koreensis]
MADLASLFDSTYFMPHGHCYLWTPSLLYLNVISDSIIALAYLSIPITLIYFIRKRRDLPFNWMFGAFGVFILACGATHLIDIYTIWTPAYWLAGFFKGITALASIVTAVLLAKLVPVALRIPSRQQLAAINSELVAANAQLQISNQRLEEANNAKRDFLANMSHELRTPLNAVLGYAQLLQRAPELAESQRHGLKVIEQSGQHLLSLISDLLDLTKIEAGKLELQPETLHLGHFLETVGDIVRLRAEDKGLAFVLRASPSLPVIVADTRRLRQVLLNLLGNAVKFTDQGQVSLAVSAVTLGDDTARLRFEVRDSGIGIAPEQQQIIFQPFEQVGDRQRRAGGTGLGLSISRRLVALMGGSIEVDSELGQGSRFSFELSVPLSAERNAVAAVPTQRVGGYLGPRRRVLVADDIETNRSLLVDLLRPLGFLVDEAHNGQAALQQIDAAPPDLVVTDLAMPVLGGLPLLQRLNARPGDRPPVIVVSASATEHDRLACRNAGAHAFLSKPIEYAALLHEIGTSLALEWTREAAPQATRPLEQPAWRVPGLDEMRILRELALAGDMRGVRDHAAHLVRLDAGYRAFAARLEQFARNYQSADLLGFVLAHLDEGSAT